jgi:hypothetical protein
LSRIEVQAGDPQSGFLLVDIVHTNGTTVDAADELLTPSAAPSPS